MTGATGLPLALYTSAQTRALDAIAIEGCGVAGIELMERAGRCAFESLVRAWPAAERIGVLCGSGNNAGDGYVVARLALESGFEVSVGALRHPRELGGDAARAFARFASAGGEVGSGVAEALDGANVVVDALLGTGAARALEGEWLEAVAAINAADAPVLALDVPSGLSADTGQPLGAAVRADLTVTFIGLKRGLFTGKGRDFAGRIEFGALGLEAAGLEPQGPRGPFAAVSPAARRARASHFGSVLGPRGRSAHKGRYGHVLVIGGELGMSGAPVLAAKAAARAGAGLVSVATRAAHAGAIAAVRPELMARGVETPSDLAPMLDRASVLCIGPGLGTGDWGRSMLEAATASGKPAVADADALNLLAGGAAAAGELWVLTPHPAEAGRLLDMTTAEVEADRFAALAALVQRWRSVVVLKGAGTLVAGPPAASGSPPPDGWPDGVALVAEEGNPGMAAGGSGDVLCGVVGALVAQGLDPASAARAGVCVHAAAGDRAATGGERGMIASDLVDALRAVVNRL